MSFQWLQMRITEEKDRRERERVINLRLPRALEELHAELAKCVDSYTAEFGHQSAEATLTSLKIRVVMREEQDDRWQLRGKVEISGDPKLPGFIVERADTEPIQIEVGMLPGDRIFYRDLALDQYLTMEELTKRVLDRVFFPKLKE